MMKCVKMLGLALVVSLAEVVLGSTPISVEQAKVAVGNFVRRSPRPLGSPASGTVVRAESEKVDGENLFHVVYLSGGGYVVTSADKDISPIMVIGDNGEFVADDRNPIYSLLKGDLRGRKRALVGQANSSQGGRPKQASVSSSSPAKSAAAEMWDELLEPAKAQQKRLSQKVDSPNDIRVAPLTKTKWDQSTWGVCVQNNALCARTNTKVFNLKTPQNAVCGCVATSMSQIMAYWKYPSKSPDDLKGLYWWNSNQYTFDKYSGVTYDWDNMPLSYESCPNISLTQATNIANLIWDVGLSVSMNYTVKGSSTETLYESWSFVHVFGYKSASLYGNEALYQHAGETLNDDFRNAIFANLDAGQPVALSIKDSEEGGHSVVGDGYAYHDGIYYIHINCGWSGISDSWYGIPDGKGMANYKNMTFNPDVFKGVVFNVNPRVAGDVISGRVLDIEKNAVPSATVKLIDGKGSVLQTTTSNGKGIYFFRVNAKGTYRIRAEHSAAVSKDATVELARITPVGGMVRTVESNAFVIKKDSDFSDSYVGCRWGVDLYLQNVEEEKIEEKKVETVAVPAFTPIGGEFEGAQEVSIKCSTWGAEIRYTADGSEPTSSSPKYSSQLTLNASTTLKARAFKDGWTPSGTAVAVFTKKVAPPEKLPKPTISPAESKFVGSCTVTLTCSDAKATIYYTTDGSVPTVASAKYTKPFTVSQTGDFTVNAIAFRAGNFTMSDVVTKTYTVTAKTKIAAPSLSPAPGTFALNTSVSISGDMSLATIHYTTDGSVPNASSPVYSAPIFISGTKTVRAIAIPNDTSKYIASDPVIGKYERDASKTINGALNNSRLVFRVSSDTASAHVSYNDADEVDLYTRDGSASLRFVIDSNTPTDNVSVSTDLVGPGVLTFWTQGDVTRTVSGRTTTTSCRETMSCLMDGDFVRTTVLASGDGYWTQQQVIVPKGTHTLTWKCSYNKYGERGRGVLDLVEWLTEAELPKVTISFDANGASGAPSFASTNDTFGSTVKLADVGSMQKPGHRFMGWNTKADGTGMFLSAGNSYSIIGRDDLTLHAMWQELVPVYVEVPYDATNVVFDIPQEYGSAWSISNLQVCDWVKPRYTLRSVGSGVHITVTLGLGSSCLNLSAAKAFTLELEFANFNDSAVSRKFEFPIYPKLYTRAPVFTVVQLPDRETDKLAGISLACPSVANAVEGTKVSCKAQLRNGRQQVVSHGVTWSILPADAAFAEVNARGEVTAKATLTAPRTVTVCASYTDAGGYSALAEREVTLVPDVGLASALKATQYEWTTGTGANAWHGQSAVSSGTGSSAMAGSAFLGTPRMSTTIVGPGTIRCRCRVTGMKGGGTLWMIVDEGKAVEAKHFCATFLADAPSDWVDVSVPVAGLGAHTLTFVYTAEGTVTETPDDNAYVEGFAYEPDTTVPYVVEYISNGKNVGTGKHCWGEVFALAKCPASSGRRFAGWACSNGRRYDDGMLVFNLAEPGETVTMTAIWE